MDLLSLLENYVPLRRVNGSRYTGPCPKCGGRQRSERFSVRTDKGFCHCYQCGFNGDLVRALRELEGMSCPEAHAAAGKECDRAGCPVADKCRKGKNGGKMRRNRLATPAERRQANADFVPSPAEVPAALWQGKAEALIVWAQEQLLDSPDQLAYLSRRGFGIAQVRNYWLGWIPRDLYRERASWGLPEIKGDSGKPKKLWLPRGIVIPTLIGPRINRIRIRRPNEDLDRDRKRNPGKDPVRYYAVPGSGNDVAVLGEAARAAIVVESDLCALLIDSVASDIITAVPLTTCSAKPKEGAARVLDTAVVILVATDTDAAGAKAFRWWQETYPGRAVRWPVRIGKDPTEAYQAGEDLRAWILAGLPISLHPKMI